MGFSSFSERVEEMIFHNRVILPTDLVPNRTAIANHVVSSLLRGRAVKAAGSALLCRSYFHTVSRRGSINA